MTTRRFPRDLIRLVGAAAALLLFAAACSGGADEAEPSTSAEVSATAEALADELPCDAALGASNELAVAEWDRTDLLADVPPGLESQGTIWVLDNGDDPLDTRGWVVVTPMEEQVERQDIEDERFGEVELFQLAIEHPISQFAVAVDRSVEPPSFVSAVVFNGDTDTLAALLVDSVSSRPVEGQTIGSLVVRRSGPVNSASDWSRVTEHDFRPVDSDRTVDRDRLRHFCSPLDEEHSVWSSDEVWVRELMRLAWTSSTGDERVVPLNLASGTGVLVLADAGDDDEWLWGIAATPMHAFVYSSLSSDMRRHGLEGAAAVIEHRYLLLPNDVAEAD